MSFRKNEFLQSYDFIVDVLLGKKVYNCRLFPINIICDWKIFIHKKVINLCIYIIHVTNLSTIFDSK